MLTPFTGWLVDSAVAGQVVIPPYDLLTSADRRHLLDTNPRTFLRAILDPVDHPGDDRLGLCRAAIDHDVAKEIFRPVPSGFAVYRISEAHRSLTGLVGELSYDGLRTTSVLGHEQVKPARVALLAEYLSTVKASSSPAAVAVRDDVALRQLLDELTSGPPDLSVGPTGQDDALQEVWLVPPDSAVVEVGRSFDPMYIVDGHHRIAAAVAVKNVPILGVVFPASELSIEAFHRVLTDATPEELAHVRARLASARRIERRPGAIRPGTVVVEVSEGVFELNVASPEVVELHRQLLPDVDARTDPRLSYVAELGEPAHAPDQVAFLVPPLGVDDVLDTAAAGGSLPPKATRFAPKARSGVFLSRR